ncbi:MAG: UvrB/UvrC motif-containing protein [Candidatus Omnitrophica bacterium]|nr:UvrB/UvrC motif-containing protein [Candidatus Omnitrophota bacterium]
MKCDMCTKKATVHLTEIIDGKVIEMHLCQECAQKKSSQMQKEFGLADLLAGLTEFQSSVQTEPKQEIKCPHCQTRFEEFKEIGRLGCSECYGAFKEQLDPLLKRIHGSNRHQGKKPIGLAVAVKETAIKPQEALNDLKEKLQGAVRTENFEQAALLRDKIRELEEHI